MYKTIRNSKKFSNIQPHISTTGKSNDLEIQNTRPKQITNSRSKYTVLKLPQQSSSMDTMDKKQISAVNRINQNSSKKSQIPITSGTKIMPATKILIIPNNSTKRRGSKNINNKTSHESFKTETVLSQTREINEIAIQTNENEILNHTLIVGDLNIVRPSKSITDEIDRVNHDKEIKKLMMSTRKFEEHSLQDEQHLDDLNEFLDKNYITRKSSKLKDDFLEEDRNIIKSMDKLLQQERPKTDSITDIKQRIQYKEQELLRLFDSFRRKIDNVSQTNVKNKAQNT